MTYRIRYSEQIDWRSFQKLSKKDKQRIRQAIEQKIAVDPLLFGKPLRRSLTGCRSLRVGPYRIIYRVQENTVDILLFGHRSDVYANAENKQ